ncbi:glutathione transferase omega class [Trametes coccinea BRFM310]|uniref:Glutathione transferase omega class n=1 Tax=Trametes coccinea (strain BRFM310) TaxID=1353009 RepID=A0A1Y2I5L1_TRAC3|nr:glutathione transferase omega class [Trametes coccinea BRFM310]
MAPNEQLTFYTAEYSPFAQRVHIALEDVHAKYTIHQFEQRGGKPEWYIEVNPFRKIPALTFGGPAVPADQPSSESVKLIESAAILEFLADVFPEANLLPANPILRAKARIFAEFYRNYVHDEFKDAFFLANPIEGIVAALEKLQRLLPPSGFAVGEWSIADIMVAPFLTRMSLFLRVGLGAYTKENWARLVEILGSDKFSRLRRYISDIHERPSFKRTWISDERQIELWKEHPGLRRKANE